jgi:hypothetical protein
MATEIIQLDTQDFSTQIYGSQDTNLISTFDIDTSLSSSSYIELFIYDNNKNILKSEYNFSNFSVLNDGQASSTNSLSQIILNPENILTQLNYDQGEYITYFNFLNKQIGSNIEPLYITEISSDRTEIRLDSTVLSNLDIFEKTNAFIQERSNSLYFLDFYLNFGENSLLISNNIVLDEQDPTNYTILVKLYEPLPPEYNVNSTLWVVSSVEESLAYKVIFENSPIVFNDTISIQGPNFNIDLQDQINNSTIELSYVDLISTNLTSSQNQLNSLLEEKELDINVDYTDFTNFIHFSSAQTRIENFYYKVGLIENYSSSISILNSTISSSTNVSESQAVLENKISNIITNFDGYEYYLYYTDTPYSYPKSNTEPPFTLESTSSVATLTWLGSTNEYSPYYGGILLSASLFDEDNKDNLLFSIPEYLREDPDNEQYSLFIDMISQHFDNIWIYYKDVTQKYNSDNRLEYGISKDIIADAIKDFGVKLYQNNFSNTDLFTAFLGLTPEGGLFPFPNITGSLPTPSGFEYIENFISASNDYIPLDDVNKSLYKRIYHNLPYLLKSKGTLPGLRALITSYGIPDTILRINEYGGKDKVNSNDWDYWQDEFNYAYSTAGDNFISSSWGLNQDWNSPDDVPSTLMFRFKTNGLPQTNIPYSQSLWYGDGGPALTLTYTGSAYSSGSYSGSIIDPEYQYATLSFYPDITEPLTSSNVYLPFFNGDWWSVMVNRSGSQFTLSTQNKIYEGGNNGTTIGFITSSITIGDDIPWKNTFTSYFPVSFSVGTLSGYDIVTYDNTAIYDASGSIIGSYTPFSGSYQEIRYYSSIISEDVFKDYTMNPYSIEGNTLNSSPNELAFRAPIGGELYLGTGSIHPKVTGSWQITHSFASGSDFYYDITPNFISNREYFFYDQPIAGIKNAISDKIRIENNFLPEGDTLSPYRRISQNTEASASYTSNINLLEVAFSPQNEINDDINSSLGFFNIGDYIGDPSQRFSSNNSYHDLNKLRDKYFEKYIKNYNLNDFIRLIKFFDNSLFKMIKDFVPARTSLASGIVIKQHILERNKYSQPQVTWEDLDISGTLKPQWNDYNTGTVENFNGGTGGTFETFNNISNVSQSWIENIIIPSGSLSITHNTQDEFYNGEFSGSGITVTTQSLNIPYPNNNLSFYYTPIVYSNGSYGLSYDDTFTQNQFLTNPNIAPSQGEMLMLDPWINGITPPFGPSYFDVGEAYIKINKMDNNGIDNTIPLGQLTNLLIKYSSSSTYITLNIVDITEYPTYYLYKISNPLLSDNYIKDYQIVASSAINPIVSGSMKVKLTSSYNPNNYYSDSTGDYSPGTVPNVRLDFTMSFTASAIGSDAEIGFITVVSGSSFLRPDSINTYSGPTLVPLSTPLKVIYTGSLNPYSLNSINPTSLINGNDSVYFTAQANKGNPLITGNVNYTNFNLQINQILSPDTPNNDSVILEPYIETINYYNSDYNPLLNNAIDIRRSTFYQDMDYSQGGLKPINFDILLEGNGIKAEIQDSNYSTLRHIIPRYNGSKSTSQFLNVWTTGDEGTYGKTPTIEDPKSVVAYCDWIGGYPPDKMNASSAHIKYLIYADGTVKIPNTSADSIYDTQNAFVTGERLIIAGGDIVSPVTSLRNIIRGGSKITPIFYNQIGHYLNTGFPQWTSSVDIFEIDNPLQTPYSIPTSNLFLSGSTSTGFGGGNYIYSQDYILFTSFNNPEIGIQINIPNSGFEPIVLPLSVKYGDEIRFMGDENKTYIITSSSLAPISDTTIFHLNKPVDPTINLNQFVIRRYIPDPNAIIFEGFKPANSSGPYIIRPEYVVPELDKNLNQFILDLTQKGLL